MKSATRHGQLATALALILFVMGILIGTPAGSNLRLPPQVADLLREQAILSMLFLAGGALAEWSKYRVLELLCGLCALAFNAFVIAGGPFAHFADLQFQWPALSRLPLILLSAGILARVLIRNSAAAYRATLSLGLSSAAVAVGMLVLESLAIAPATDGFQSGVIGLGSLLLAWIWVFLIYRAEHSNDKGRLRQLAWPSVVAVGSGAASSIAIIMRTDTLASPQRNGAVIVVSLIAFWLAAAIWSALTASSTVIEHRRVRERQNRLLARLRRLVHRHAGKLSDAHIHYADLFNNIPTPLVLTTPTGWIITANRSLRELLGIAPDDDLGTTNLSDFYADPSDRGKLIQQWRSSDRNIFHGEVTMRRADGQLLDVTYSLRVVRKPDRTIDYLQGTITDITDLRRAEAARRKLESSLRLSQKLEAVGRLAAGIAHEINTPMQYIGDNVYFLKQSFETIRDAFEEQSRLREQLSSGSAEELGSALRAVEETFEFEDIMQMSPGAFSRAQEGIAAVSHIVSAMKELAHPGDGSKTSTDINHLIDTALTVSRNAYKTVAKIDTDLRDVPNVLAYKNELCQVIINLVVNAAHAIESAKESSELDGIISISTSVEDDKLVIRVKDNGCGIPETVLERIFDPFFTTKGVGKGTGQGLALARSVIVDKHGGAIHVDSEVGSGTTFTIRLETRDSADEAGEDMEDSA